MRRKQQLILFFSTFSLSFFLSCHSHKKTSETEKKETAHVSSSKIKMIAGTLGVNEKDIRDKKLYEFVGEWYGVPYKYGGCSKSGTDCSCLTINLYSSVYHKQLPRSADDMAKACDKVKESKAEEGDMVFFKINSKTVSHVGVVLKNNKFVHASTSKGVLISDLNEAYYKKYFYCFGRFD